MQRLYRMSPLRAYDVRNIRGCGVDGLAGNSGYMTQGEQSVQGPVACRLPHTS